MNSKHFLTFNIQFSNFQVLYLIFKGSILLLPYLFQRFSVNKKSRNRCIEGMNQDMSLINTFSKFMIIQSRQRGIVENCYLFHNVEIERIMSDAAVHRREAETFTREFLRTVLLAVRRTFYFLKKIASSTIVTLLVCVLWMQAFFRTAASIISCAVNNVIPLTKRCFTSRIMSSTIQRIIQNYKIVKFQS